ncbi:hypothetical protein SmJEL517_g02462 [Synchytrium microbalum]|uniref:Myb-like domain-containing protein n=1 Tax=Synchytrium microbalum TaxID=1806994 RepID=A0A507CBS3_9FUNG|nr:uncharacterized protein SmJEL517_g02462 [Synchytrium microbalum]TPX35015.1 hypothetical protein SmJEL517_g02462 [Synchytrium microbalum]
MDNSDHIHVVGQHHQLQGIQSTSQAFDSVTPPHSPEHHQQQLQELQILSNHHAQEHFLHHFFHHNPQLTINTHHDAHGNISHDNQYMLEAAKNLGLSLLTPQTPIFLLAGPPPLTSPSPTTPHSHHPGPTGSSSRRNSRPKNPNQKTRVPWTPQEDECLIAGVQKHGAGRWSDIFKDSTSNFDKSRKASDLRDRFRVLYPTEYTSLYPNSQPRRLARKAYTPFPASTPGEGVKRLTRERAPKRPFTVEEDIELLEAVATHGAAWTRIATATEFCFAKGGRRAEPLRWRFRNLAPESNRLIMSGELTPEGQKELSAKLRARAQELRTLLANQQPIPPYVRKESKSARAARVAKAYERIEHAATHEGLSPTSVITGEELDSMDEEDRQLLSQYITAKANGQHFPMGDDDDNEDSPIEYEEPTYGSRYIDNEQAGPSSSNDAGSGEGHDDKQSIIAVLNPGQYQHPVMSYQIVDEGIANMIAWMTGNGSRPHEFTQQ